MTTKPKTTTQTFKDGFSIKKDWRYVYRNGHSAWDGYKWVPRWEIVSPSGVVYVVGHKDSVGVRATIAAARLLETHLGKVALDMPFDDARALLSQEQGMASILWGDAGHLLLTALRSREQAKKAAEQK